MLAKKETILSAMRSCEDDLRQYYLLKHVLDTGEPAPVNLRSTQLFVNGVVYTGMQDLYRKLKIKTSTVSSRRQVSICGHVKVVEALARKKGTQALLGVD